MIKLLILGGTGMLGNEVTKYFLDDGEYDVTVTYRNESVRPFCKSIKFDVLKDSLDVLPNDFDYVINCIGVIKPFMEESKLNAVKVNSIFPLELGMWCNKNNTKLIHISTDCVFSGNRGKYVESDLHDATDDYGKSKSLGESDKDTMIIRTSIIGEEIHKNASLIAWAKSQKGKTVNGFSTHLWNGITTKQFAKVCDKIIKNGWYEKGIFHVFAKDDVSKYEILKFLNDKYELNLNIIKTMPERVNRTLRTEKKLCEKLEIPTVEDMIKEI